MPFIDLQRIAKINTEALHNKQRPTCVKAELNGIVVTALIDSGNNVFDNAISEKLLNALGISHNSLQKFPCSVGTAQTGTSLEVIGQLSHNLTLLLGECPIPLHTRPIVIQNLSMSLNISAHFMLENNISLMNKKPHTWLEFQGHTIDIIGSGESQDNTKQVAKLFTDQRHVIWSKRM